MKIGPRYKIAKRPGASVFDKTQTQKFAIAKERAERTKSKKRGLTAYGKQLLEKQKVRVTYGITERQFQLYVKKALRVPSGTPAAELHRPLELRLDNVIYRLGLTTSRRAARQMVSHGHITVEGVKTTIPSRTLHENEVFAVREGSRGARLFEFYAARAGEYTVPAWLSWDSKKLSGNVVGTPTVDANEAAGDLVAVLSFYSR